MSEKELRKYVRHTKDCAAHSHMARRWGARCNCGLKEALSADPDLINLLRWVGAEYEMSLGLRGEEVAFGSVIDKIEKAVRLTDEPPGWEWAEEEDDLTEQTEG